MARKRNDLGSAGDAQIEALMARGGTAESISAALRAAGIKGASRPTVGRRMQELRGKAPASAQAAPGPRFAPGPPPGPDPPLPAAPDAIPEGADMATLDRWLVRAEEAGRQAEIDGNLAALGQMGRLASALLEAKRKATPLPKPDPNDNPDMVAAARRAREMLHKAIDQVVTG